MAQERKKPKNKSSFNAEEATKHLEDLLKLPEPLAHDRVLTWIRAGLYLITPEQVQYAVTNKISGEHVIFNYLHLTHPLVRPLARQVFRIFWDSVSYYLTDAVHLYSILAAKPKIRAVLDTPEGHEWIDNCCLSGYIWLFNFTWT
ncbi:MAG: hypothetical protein ACE5L6_01990 [Candidatus Bathyarchaeia archaeon]